MKIDIAGHKQSSIRKWKFFKAILGKRRRPLNRIFAQTNVLYKKNDHNVVGLLELMCSFLIKSMCLAGFYVEARDSVVAT